MIHSVSSNDLEKVVLSAPLFCAGIATITATVVVVFVVVVFVVVVFVVVVFVVVVTLVQC